MPNTQSNKYIGEPTVVKSNDRSTLADRLRAGRMRIASTTASLPSKAERLGNVILGSSISAYHRAPARIRIVTGATLTGVLAISITLATFGSSSPVEYSMEEPDAHFAFTVPDGPSGAQDTANALEQLWRDGGMMDSTGNGSLADAENPISTQGVVSANSDAAMVDRLPAPAPGTTQQFFAPTGNASDGSQGERIVSAMSSLAQAASGISPTAVPVEPYDPASSVSVAVLTVPTPTPVMAQAPVEPTAIPLTPTPAPTSTPAPVPTATPDPLPTATVAPLPTATPVPASSINRNDNSRPNLKTEPTATAVPVATSTPVPLPTAVPTTVPAEDSDLFGIVAQAPAFIAEPTATSDSDYESEPSFDDSKGDEVRATVTPEPTATPDPTETPETEAAPESSSNSGKGKGRGNEQTEPTATPASTATPEPTATPGQISTPDPDSDGTVIEDTDPAVNNDPAADSGSGSAQTEAEIIAMFQNGRITYKEMLMMLYELYF